MCWLMCSNRVAFAICFVLKHATTPTIYYLNYCYITACLFYLTIQYGEISNRSRCRLLHFTWILGKKIIFNTNDFFLSANYFFYLSACLFLRNKNSRVTIFTHTLSFSGDLATPISKIIFTNISSFYYL